MNLKVLCVVYILLFASHKNILASSRNIEARSSLGFAVRVMLRRIGLRTRNIDFERSSRSFALLQTKTKVFCFQNCYCDFACAKASSVFPTNATDVTARKRQPSIFDVNDLLRHVWWFFLLLRSACAVTFRQNVLSVSTRDSHLQVRTKSGILSNGSQ